MGRARLALDVYDVYATSVTMSPTRVDLSLADTRAQQSKDKGPARETTSRVGAEVLMRDGVVAKETNDRRKKDKEAAETSKKRKADDVPGRMDLRELGKRARNQDKVTDGDVDRVSVENVGDVGNVGQDVVVVGDGSTAKSGRYDFDYSFRGNGQHISQDKVACAELVRSVQGPTSQFVPPLNQLVDRDPFTSFGGHVVEEKKALEVDMVELKKRLEKEVGRRREVASFVKEQMTRLRKSRATMVERAGTILRKKTKARVADEFGAQLARLSRYVQENATCVPAGTYEFANLDILEVTEADFRYNPTAPQASPDLLSYTMETNLSADDFGMHDSWGSVESRVPDNREVDDDADSAHIPPAAQLGSPTRSASPAARSTDA
ncbi:hypothetical protein AALP_AAs60586U000100 [Arabis alpina]|uniref:Uncharacterized protein n=1 Tax=Arabis alpina TaxID=50452 RepID=A0A087G2H7_ARAAL|nr:hypothetical protein AALP_AAs60586U000100 [Arabis alpina]